MPALFSTVLTPEGLGIVIGIDPSNASCWVQLFTSGKILHLALTAVSVVQIA